MRSCSILSAPERRDRRLRALANAVGKISPRPFLAANAYWESGSKKRAFVLGCDKSTSELLPVVTALLIPRGETLTSQGLQPRDSSLVYERAPLRGVLRSLGSYFNTNGLRGMCGQFVHKLHETSNGCDHVRNSLSGTLRSSSKKSCEGCTSPRELHFRALGLLDVLSMRSKDA